MPSLINLGVFFVLLTNGALGRFLPVEIFQNSSDRNNSEGQEDCNCEWRFFQHYEAKGCQVVETDSCGCATNYLCSSVKQSVSQSKVCMYQSVAYKVGEKIKLADTCQVCRCVDGITPQVVCRQRECPQLEKVEGTNCHLVYEANKCCPSRYECVGELSDNAAETSAVTCVYNNVTYPLGSKIYPPDDPCLVCECNEDWNGIDNSTCYQQECVFERKKHLLDAGCIPIYHERKCCPIEYYCPEDLHYNVMELRELETDNSTENGGSCIFGGNSYEIGAELLLNNSCVKCTCQVPPDFTCVHQSCSLPPSTECIEIRSAGQCCPTYDCLLGDSGIAETAATEGADNAVAETSAKEEVGNAVDETSATEKSDSDVVEASTAEETDNVFAETSATEGSDNAVAETSSKEEGDSDVAETSATEETDNVFVETSATEGSDNAVSETSTKEVGDSDVAETSATEGTDDVIAETSVTEGSDYVVAETSAKEEGDSDVTETSAAEEVDSAVTETSATEESDGEDATTEEGACPTPLCADDSCRIEIPPGHDCPTCVCGESREKNDFEPVESISEKNYEENSDETESEKAGNQTSADESDNELLSKIFVEKLAQQTSNLENLEHLESLLENSETELQTEENVLPGTEEYFIQFQSNDTEEDVENHLSPSELRQKRSEDMQTAQSQAQQSQQQWNVLLQNEDDMETSETIEREREFSEDSDEGFDEIKAFGSRLHNVPTAVTVKLEDTDLDNVIWTSMVPGCPTPLCANSSCRIGIPPGHMCPTCICQDPRVP